MTERRKILFVANWPLKHRDRGSDYAFFSQWETRPELKLIGTPRLGFVTRLEKNLLRFYFVASFIAFFRSFFRDVVIAYSSQVGLPLAFLLRLAFWRKVRLVVFDVETFGRPKAGPRLGLVRFAAKRFDRVVYASSRQMEFYRRHLPELEKKLRYIPIGIGRYEKNRSVDSAGEGPIVAPGHHGREFRDWATLLRAYAHLVAARQLLIIGRNEMPAEDREGVPIPDGCRFEPFLPIEEFQKRVEDAPFVVLPLPERGQSLGQLTVLFSMAMGKAVIGTRVMGIEDYVEEGVTGFLVPPGDDAAMCLAMRDLLANPQKAVRMGKAAFERVREKFNDRVMGLAWEKVVNELF